MPIIRRATPGDVDDIVSVVMATMPHNPQWTYRFPFKDQFPEDHYRYTSMLYEQFTDPSQQNWEVLVVEHNRGAQQHTPNEEERGYQKSIVAFAVYDMSYRNADNHTASFGAVHPAAYVLAHGGSTRKDANVAHNKAFREGSEESKKLLARYPTDRQLGLQILGTHPEHWRHGHATALVEWGMELAEREQLVMTLTASAMGRFLYEKLGFVALGNVVYQVQGEEEKVVATVLVYEPKIAKLSHV